MNTTAGARRRTLALAAATATIVGSIVAADAVAQAADPVRDGTVPERAGASCWSIKQDAPASTDGVYWLQTDPMVHADQFYCDMTTDGGGWVLIGRGRDNWTFFEHGQGTAAGVRDTIDGPSAFEPQALDTETIDALLGGGDVKDLVDGVRIRRAADINGTTWQEVRWTFLDLGSWSWAINGGHRLNGVSIDGTSYPGGNTRDSFSTVDGGIASGLEGQNNANRLFTYTWSGHANRRGFSYGSTVQGGNGAADYLWENANEGHALPFAQVFIRPQIASSSGAAIPDTGLAAETLSPRISDRHEVLQAGVVGVLKVGDTEPALDTPVQAFAEFGDRIFVGGKFASVELGPGGTLVAQPYLAAFDRSTGAWIDTFLPAFDGTVWDLAVSGNRLYVAGQFTSVNGVAGTSSLVALDPLTGQVDTGWQADVAITGTTDRPTVRGIDIEGSWLYVGGNFTSITTNGNTVAVPRSGRVSLTTGDADTAFRPDVDGVVYDLDAHADRVQLAGDFFNVNGTPRTGHAAVLQADGQLVPGVAEYQPSATNPQRRYQQAVLAEGDEIWLGGSEHNTHVYANSDFTLLRSHITHNRGGDTQAFAQAGSYVIQGSHANRWTFTDSNAWPSTAGYTRIDNYQWMGLFDATTHDYVVDWVPQLATAGDEGAWALYTDVDGCVWFGGDFIAGDYISGGRKYVKGFSKYCPRDAVAPTVPPNGEVEVAGGGTGVTVTWDASTDDRPGFIGYEVLRGDRVVSDLVYGETFVDGDGVAGDRYFIRAVDAAGNRSATTAVIVAGADLEQPSTPQNLVGVVTGSDSADLSWDASTDNVGVTGYVIYRNGVEVATSATNAVSVTGLLAGDNYMQVEAVDAAGNVSARTPSTIVFIDGQKPSTPQNLVGVVTGSDSADLSWDASTDNVGVTGYVIYRNGVEVATSATNAVSVTGLLFGDNYMQVEAVDAAGNVSFRTPSTIVFIQPPDTQRPSTPQNLVGVVTGSDSADLSWDASTDNVGVTGYTIRRNGVVIASSVASAVSVTGLQPGNNYIQVEAEDAAGNVSFKTPPIVLFVDDQRPSTPQNLAGVVTGADSADLSWDASTDNVGVTGYTIRRNGVVIASSVANAVSVTGLQPGNNYIQVEAEDAAGNVSFKTPPIVLFVDDQRPSTPQNLAGVVTGADAADLTWDASTDNVGVTGYTIRRNGVVIATSATNAASVTGLQPGNNYIQVEAEDAAGNVSFKTAPIVLVIDVQAPSTPQNLAGTPTGADSADLTWDASSDNVGVTGYTVFRNGVVIATVATNSASVTGLQPGDNYIQVQAFDAAGNLSFKTSPVIVVIP